MTIGYNRVLGCQKKAADARLHRVGLANWPATITDPRTASLEALIAHTATSGYEGFEIAPAGFMKYFPGQSEAVVARKVKEQVTKAGLSCFGATFHIADNAMRQLRWRDKLNDSFKATQDMGGQYLSFQIHIHPDYQGTGGAYRQDEEYLRWCAQQVSDLRDQVWALDMNFYLEVHVDRITEDPQALCRILDMATCELNGDMSHYYARGFVRGQHVDRIMKHVGHAHVRMARRYGDLSAVVEDPKADWQAKGVTWQMFEYMKPALEGGLSSRAILGETGPMHLVKDTLTQDASLVPLYRAMARYADASAQGIAMKVESPDDLQPFGK